MGRLIGQEHTYTGDIVTFDSYGGTIESVLTEISPSQDLHGYASPWGPGGGANLCRVARTYTTTSQGITYSENEFGTVHCEGTASAESVSAGAPNTAYADARCLYTLPAGTYTIANISGVRIYVAFRNAANTENLRSSLNIQVGNSYTYTATEPVIIYIRADILTGETVDADVLVMVTAGSTAATVYEPFQNICPITGVTSVSYVRCGKNVLQKRNKGVVTSNGLTFTTNSDGTVTVNGLASAQTFFPYRIWTEKRIEVGDILSGCPAGGSPTTYELQLDADGVVGALDTGSGGTVTSVGANNAVYIRIRAGYQADNLVFRPMIRRATSSQTYETYKSQGTTINWYSQIGTVYAGTYDLISGEINARPYYESYNGEALIGPWMSSMEEYAVGVTPTIGAQVVDLGGEYTQYTVVGRSVATLWGVNNLWFWAGGGNTSVTVNEPLRGFLGWLIKCVTNGTGVEIPLKYIRAETYSVTPDQRMEWSAERDVTGVLHRETVQNLPPKIEFSTPLMDNSGINALNTIIRNAYTDELQRNITIQFYDPERNEYWEWDCYMPDVHYQIRNVDVTNHIINYEETRYAFIGY